MLAENASLIDPENPDLNMMVNADVHPKLLIAMLTGKLPVSNEELNYWLSLSANSSSTVTEMSYLYFNKGDLFIPRLDLLDEANLEYFKKQTDFHLNAIQKNSKLDVNNREQLKLGYSIVSRNAEILLHLFEEPGMLENNLPTTQFWEKAVEENYTQVFHVMDILTKEMIDSLPKEKQPFFRFAKICSSSFPS